MSPTAVIGLGAMGAGIAANLYRAGQLAAAWNRTRERGEAVAASCGLPLADTLEALPAQAEVLISSVSADADLLEVIDRLLPHLGPRHTWLDTSTVSAATAREAAARLAATGASFLDGPVSGGREGAEQGTLVMMAGGDAGRLDALRPMLAAFTRQVVHMGEIGSGQATKAVNQIMAAGINQAVTEALAFGAAEGLDMAQVIEVIAGGAAGNWFLAHRGASMLDGRFTPGFRVALHDKDLAICQRMAAARGAQLPIVEMTRVHYRRLREQGFADEDISSLMRLKRALFADHG